MDHGYGTTPGKRNQARGYYVPLNNVANKILAFTASSGSGGSATQGTFTTAPWAAGGSAASPYTSTISTIGAGGLLKDCGTTRVSAGRVFRRIQLICPTVSTFGVAGPAPGSTSPQYDFLTGYIELASAGITDDYPGGTGPAQVAFYPIMY